MATTTTNFGWDIPQSTDLVKDGATAIAALGQDIDTALIDLKGGTTGQVLAKASNTDLDYSWVAQDDSNAIQNAIVDAKGDLIAATAADTPARLAVGTNGHVLTADSTAATGLKWAAAGGGGKVLQVVQGSTASELTLSSTSFVDTNLSLSITPTAATSKILILINQQAWAKRSTNNTGGLALKLVRNTTDIFNPNNAGGEALHYVEAGGASSLEMSYYMPMTYLDSPSTTSSVTYKTQARLAASTSTPTGKLQQGSSTSVITLIEIGA